MNFINDQMGAIIKSFGMVVESVRYPMVTNHALRLTGFHSRRGPFSKQTCHDVRVHDRTHSVLWQRYVGLTK
jgi:hypothetical protein